MENVIDVGVIEVKLVIKDVGKVLIQVIDNGCGMFEIDVCMAFEWYVIFKIWLVQDLFVIWIMGFCGEVLAFIVVIVQVEIKICCYFDELGICLVIEGLEIKIQEFC